MNMAARPRIVRCPGCAGPSVYAVANPYRPFCSARCKNHDFGAWASEGYRVDAKADPEFGDVAGEDSDANPPRQ
jgi:uncharacterized protein